MSDEAIPGMPQDMTAATETQRQLLLQTWEEGYRAGAESTLNITRNFVRNLGRRDVADLLAPLGANLLQLIDEHIRTRRG